MFPTSLTGVVITAALVNFLCYQIIGIPVIYCAGLVVAQKFEPWVAMVRIILATLVILLAWWRYDFKDARAVLAVWIAFEIIPVIASVIFGFGYTCGDHPSQVPVPHMHKPVTEVDKTAPMKSAPLVVARVSEEPEKHPVEPPRRLYPPPPRQARRDGLSFDTSPMVGPRERSLASRELY